MFWTTLAHAGSITVTGAPLAYPAQEARRDEVVCTAWLTEGEPPVAHAVTGCPDAFADAVRAALPGAVRAPPGPGAPTLFGLQVVFTPGPDGGTAAWSDVTWPIPVHRVTPRYPPGVRVAEFRCQAELEVEAATGRVVEVALPECPSPYAVEAEAALLQWRYEPLTWEGMPARWGTTLAMLWRTRTSDTPLRAPDAPTDWTPLPYPEGHPPAAEVPRVSAGLVTVTRDPPIDWTTFAGALPRESTLCPVEVYLDGARPYWLDLTDCPAGLRPAVQARLAAWRWKRAEDVPEGEVRFRIALRFSPP